MGFPAALLHMFRIGSHSYWLLLVAVELSTYFEGRPRRTPRPQRGSFALVLSSVTRAHIHLQRPGSWPENEVQQLVDAEWRKRCRYGTEEQKDEDAVDARALVGQARMLKMVRSWKARTRRLQA